MRILLVTLTGFLPTSFATVLNPENEYCAIVVDEVKPARQILSQINFPAERVYPFYDLKDCIENFYYDFVLCISPEIILNTISKHFRDFGLPANKFVHVCLSNGRLNGFLIERALSYYEEHAADFEMFATGLSYTAAGLDMNQFKRKLINLGGSSQDLYYDYQIAKRVLTPSRRGGAALRLDWIGSAELPL